MKYKNPIIPGFYPDPSVTKGKDRYYLVTSSFEYFPGVPIFESNDLLNWKSIGSVLTKPSQIDLKDADGHGGIYAPTIRYQNGKYYVITTNVTHGGHFFVTTNNPHDSWSEPVYIDQEGIDPSLFFDDKKAYFMSTAKKDNKNAILVSEINLKNGFVSNSHYVWFGNGGRYLEGPHLYKINDYYYLLASEGGTEYGHMLVVARSKNVFGPYENCPENPILTNRDLGGYQLQGAGHGDFVQDKKGNWWVIFLGFRQLERYMQFHTLGREVNLLPIKFIDNWPSIGNDKTARLEVETNRLNVKQDLISNLRQKNAKIGYDLFTLRNPNLEDYNLQDSFYRLKGNKYTLNMTTGSPTALFTRQRSFKDKFSIKLDPEESLSGITAFLEADQHYDLLIKKISKNKYLAKMRLVIGPAYDVKVQKEFVSKEVPTLKIECNPKYYSFLIKTDKEQINLGKYEARFLASEVAGNFTGVMFGIFNESNNKTATFTELMRTNN